MVFAPRTVGSDGAVLQSNEGVFISYGSESAVADQIQAEMAGGVSVYFGRGRIDEYCVFVETDSRRHAPKDVAYFDSLKTIADRHGELGRDKVYAIFQRLYDSADRNIRQDVLDTIAEEVKNFGGDALLLEHILVTIYYAMVAEESRGPKERFPLGKRLKKIGVYQLLVEDVAPSKAANSSKGRPWRDLLKICEEIVRREAAVRMALKSSS